MLFYAVNLKKPGIVTFEYFYPDNAIYFEFFVSVLKQLDANVIFGTHLLTPPSAAQVQNDQCQSTDSVSRWMKISETKWSKYMVCLSVAVLRRSHVIDRGLQIPTVPVHCA